MSSYIKKSTLVLIGMLLSLSSCYVKKKQCEDKVCPIMPDPTTKIYKVDRRKASTASPVCYGGTMYLQADNGAITILPDNDKDGWFECTAKMKIPAHTIGCWRGYQMYYFDNGDVAPVISKGKYKECK